MTTTESVFDPPTAAESPGRRPALLSRAATRAVQTVGALFAEMARLEEASVEAFRVLYTELSAHRAPAALLVGCARASEEELRHARVTGDLARRYGVEPLSPNYRSVPWVRSLEEIAKENAIGVWIRETYGALLASWQAQHTGDSRLADAMRTIAADEARHAELACAISAWVHPRLSDVERARVEAAHAEALHTLSHEIAQRVPEASAAAAGVPCAANARSLLDNLVRELVT